ncbi:MAG: hypothetical protein EOO36_20590, partial [Cytophagaceae bacterium]
MRTAIPTYRLHMFAHYDEVATEVFCPPPHRVGEKTTVPLTAPYRSDYYKISLCLRGTAEVRVNLQPYAVAPGSVVLVTPHIIKQWTRFSPDYETLCVFFTADFLAANNAQVGKLGFLRNPRAYVLPLAAPEAASLAASLRFLHQKYYSPHTQRKQIVQSILNGLLYELSALYEQPPADLPVASARSQALTAAFKQLVQVHSAQTRHVPFYAAALCVTPKH